MIIKKADYVLSAAWESQWPETEIPEICLAGRSNVGKSSFINTMLQRKAVAKISGKPGKTRTLNFYNVNDEMHFVDVPGYGYAEVNASIQESFGKMIESYIEKREQLKCMILIIDFRHKPSRDDVDMYEYIKYNEIPTVVVATKLDKVSRNDWIKNEKLIKNTLEFDPNHKFIKFSSETKFGREEVWEEILKLIA